MPNIRSNIKSKAALNKTGKDNTPKIAVTKKAQMVKGKRVMAIPFVRKLMMVTM